MTNITSLVWLRNDLRLSDNLALAAAAEAGDAVVPVYIYSPEDEGAWAHGAASRWWLHHSLVELSAALEALGAPLVVRRGGYVKELFALIERTGARHVFWNRRYEPGALAIDEQIQRQLQAEGLAVKTFNSSLLHDPFRLRTKEDRPFKVFTPFWNHFQATQNPPPPLIAPERLGSAKVKIESLSIDELQLLPQIDWAKGFRETWRPGEQGAQERLEAFLDGAIVEYATERDRPDHKGVSMLSPHLHFGEIGPRQIFHAAREARRKSTSRQGFDIFIKELGWREFAHHVLVNFPQTPEEPLREQFKQFPWSCDAKLLKRWQKGETGYPIVDAGMRELWHTGWMHNRVRMIVASFLTKDLLISWREGAAWFWDTLVDADLANNTLGWQWASGCGADAAPYFRIFNPELQGEKFDPQGSYVRKWVPEIAALPDKYIHKPQRAPEDILKAAGLVLGRDYPLPAVDHGQARQRALGAFAKIKRSEAEEVRA